MSSARLQLLDPETPDERRAYPRFIPDPAVPVLFAHPHVETPTAGLIQDVSEGGVRIVAPPTARPGLHWADPLRIEISYSESTRAGQVEGTVLRAYVVRLVVDASQLVIQARFDRQGADGAWEAFAQWLASLQTPAP
ncbi:MAG: PilZ domain-containing protein [Myxococcales bacterium]|nr:PilZ domain-containing protein [Myxococcales bacterium]